MWAPARQTDGPWAASREPASQLCLSLPPALGAGSGLWPQSPSRGGDAGTRENPELGLCRLPGRPRLRDAPLLSCSDRGGRRRAAGRGVLPLCCLGPVPEPPTTLKNGRSWKAERSHREARVHVQELASPRSLGKRKWLFLRLFLVSWRA